MAPPAPRDISMTSPSPSGSAPPSPSTGTPPPDENMPSADENMPSVESLTKGMNERIRSLEEIREKLGLREPVNAESAWQNFRVLSKGPEFFSKVLRGSRVVVASATAAEVLLDLHFQCEGS